MDPEKFGETHYPNDPRWQLVNDPKTKKEFWKKKKGSNHPYKLTDSLSILIDTSQVEKQLITIRGAYAEQKDTREYVNSIIRLGWSLIGNTYDSLKLEQGKKVMDYAATEYKRLAPYRKHNESRKSIQTGIWLYNKRQEIKE